MASPRYLLPDERPEVNVRRHWAVLVGPGLRAAAGLAVLLLLWLSTGSATLAGILSIAMLVVFGWFGWKVAEWRHDRFVVTEKRALMVTGLITIRVGMMPLRKVTDMTYERSWLGRRLNYGAFVMESAGQDQALHRVDYVPHPEAVSQRMFALLFNPPPGAGQGARQPAQLDPDVDELAYIEGDRDTDGDRDIGGDPDVEGHLARPHPRRAEDYPTDPNLPLVELPDLEPSDADARRE